MHDTFTYLEKYCYLTDKQSFYNRRNKNPVQENTVLNAIIKERPSLRKDVAKAAEALENMKIVGIKSDQLSEKVAQIQPADIYEQVKDLLPYYWFCRIDGEEALYYVSSENEATPLLNVSPEGFLTSIRSNKDLFKILHETYTALKTENPKTKLIFQDYIKLLYQELRMDPSRGLLEPPQLISWSSSELAYKQFNPSFLSDQPTPTWDQFLGRVDYPEVFLAWVWSIFVPSNKGRQALWLQGSGGDGKSRVTYALSQIFGQKQTASVSQDSFGNQFFFSTVYGKKLTIYGDCKNVRLISHSKIHSLLGGDTVAIERKGQDSFSDRVYSRLLIASNYYPEIDFSMRNERSRIIQLEVSPPSDKYSHGDPNFEDNLIAEKWGFLFKAKTAYDKLCPSGMDLIVPKDLMNKMELRCCSRESEILDQFIDHRIIIEEDARAIKEDIRQSLIEFFLKHSNKKYDFVQKDLEKRLREWGVKDGRERIRGMMRNIWIGVRLKKEEEI